MIRLILLVIGSPANIIAMARGARGRGGLTFAEHARCGIPMTLLSFLIALVSLLALGYVAF
jgi:Na+/H+ antiporter NhaD/arsenite permease-like protein